MTATLQAHNRRRPANRTRRREFLRLGLAGVGSLGIADLLRLRSRAAVPAQRTALIVVWLHGGASHLETYDPKPRAAAEFRRRRPGNHDVGRP